MAQIFLSESSRRNQQISDVVMNQNWAESFGEKKPMVCSKCGERPYNGRLYEGGLCRNCRTVAPKTGIGPRVIIK